MILTYHAFKIMFTGLWIIALAEYATTSITTVRALALARAMIQAVHHDNVTFIVACRVVVARSSTVALSRHAVVYAFHSQILITNTKVNLIIKCRYSRAISFVIGISKGKAK